MDVRLTGAAKIPLPPLDSEKVVGPLAGDGARRANQHWPATIEDMARIVANSPAQSNADLHINATPQTGSSRRAEATSSSAGPALTVRLRRRAQR